MSTPTDKQCHQSASLLVDRLVQQCGANGWDPETAWIVLGLATDTIERALVYATGVLPAGAAEYAAAKERLERLLKEARSHAGETGEKTDQMLGVRRGVPQ